MRALPLDRDRELRRVDRHGVGAILRLVDADQQVRELEHVVAQADDDKLCVCSISSATHPVSHGGE